MDVLLINPPYETLRTADKVPAPPGRYPPLGIAYIAAVLEKNDINVGILDAEILQLNLKEIIKYIDKVNPKIVGLTAFTVTIDTALDIAKSIKREFPHITIVIGGPHAFYQWGEILKKGGVDYVVIGEGEYTVLKLVRSLEEGSDISDIQGLAFKRDGEVISTAISPRILNLDELPFPARHLLPMDKYVAPFLVRLRGKPYTTLITSRGCPFNCQFCASKMWERKVTYLSVERVGEELCYISQKLGIKYISFADDVFTLNKKRVHQICDIIIEKDLDLQWACEIRVGTVDEDLLVKMKEAGCRGLYIGMEFGDQRVLDFATKGTTLEEARDTVKIINKIGGFKTQGYFMLGYPTETKETIKRTIDFAKSLGLLTVAFSITVPFPGTELYKYCKENGLLIHEDWQRYSPKMGDMFIKLDDIDERELYELLKNANRGFYLRPSYIVKSLFSVRSLNDLKFYISVGLRML
jgi:anaerobic magnesium-protoporphyrin IX monomethyl ester cyclase